MKMRRRIAIAALTSLLCWGGSIGAADIALEVYGKGGAGEWDNPVLQEEHPEIIWRGGDVLSGSAQDLAQALTARQPYDLYALNYTDQNFREIMQKGFALDLSAYPALSAYGSRLRPYLQGALGQAGRIYGVPIQLTTSMWAYSPDAFAQVGLSEADVPSTYAEFLNLLAWWIEEDRDTGVQFVRGAADLRAELANVITKALIERYDDAENPEPFNSAHIVEIYEKLDALDTAKIDAYLSSLEEGDSYGTPALFALGFDGLEIRNYEENAGLVPMTLCVEAGEQARVPVSMRVFFISADSSNPDAAALYLDAYLRGLGEHFPIVAQAGPHEPVRDLRAEEEIVRLNAQIESLRRELAQEEADAEAIEQQIDQAGLQLERMEKRRFRVPQEKIDRLAALEGALYVPAYSPLGSMQSEGYRSIQMLIDQYAARQIDARTLLIGIDQKIDMIRMEGK